MEDTSRSEVQEILEELDFRVEPIEEEPGQKRADLRVADAENSYLVEVKTRLGSNFEANLSEHGAAESFNTLGHANSVSSQVKDAAKQLSATSALPAEFQLLWYQNLDQDEYERVYKTLYGVVTVIRPGSELGAESVDCLHLTFSEFFRYPQIVGAICADQNGGILLLNIQSPECDRFRTSRFFQVFYEHGAVLDPLTAESLGGVYIANCSGSRRTENRQVLLRYVEEKYGVQHLVDVEPKHSRVAILRKWNVDETIDNT